MPFVFCQDQDSLVHKLSSVITKGSVIALNRVDNTTVLVTNPGRTSNSVAKIVVITAVGILASIIDVALLKPCNPMKPATKTATTGPINNRIIDAGIANRTLVMLFKSAICMPSTTSITGIAPAAAISILRINGEGIGIDNEYTIRANTTA